MNDTVKWWLQKAVLLVFLLSQFYLAKKFGEPYPCVILPSFAQAYSIEELPATSTYTFLLDKKETLDTLQLGKLFPFVPLSYWSFTTERLFTLSATEEREWQLILKEQLELNEPAVLRIEQWIDQWESRNGNPLIVRNKGAVREIDIVHGLPE